MNHTYFVLQSQVFHLNHFTTKIHHFYNQKDNQVCVSLLAQNLGMKSGCIAFPNLARIKHSSRKSNVIPAIDGWISEVTTIVSHVWGNGQ